MSIGNVLTTPTLRSLLSKDGHPVGAFTFLNDPAVVEVAGISGIEFIVIDTEHAVRNPTDLLAHIRAADVAGLPAMVRVSGVDDPTISKALDMGAKAIISPFVSSATDAAQLVDSVRYPPRGRRGVCRSTRANLYGGALSELQRQMQAADEDVLVFGTLEDPEALLELGHMADCGIDGFFFGVADLSARLGVAGDFKAPRVEQTIAQMLEVISRTNCLTMHMVADLTQIPSYVRDEPCFVVMKPDVQVLSAAYRSIHSELKNELTPISHQFSPRR